MTGPTEDAALTVCRRARRRLRAQTALQLGARHLWRLAAVAWCIWLMHRFLVALPGWAVAIVFTGLVVVAAIAIVRRLPGKTECLLETDRLLGAKSLLICAQELARTAAVDTPAKRRIARDTNTLVPTWSAALVERVPVAWPGHGTFALLATAAAGIVLSLPGAPADTAPGRTGADPGPIDAAATTALARTLALNTTGGQRDDAGAEGPEAPAPIPRASADSRVNAVDPTELSEPGAMTRPASAPPPADPVAGGSGSGDTASAARAGTAVAGREKTPTDLATQAVPIQRSGVPESNDPGYVALTLGPDGERAPDHALTAHAGPEATGVYYLSPSMRRYLDRLARTPMETRP